MANKAYLNELGETGTRSEIFDWLRRVDEDNDRLRAVLQSIASSEMPAHEMAATAQAALLVSPARR